MKQCLFTVTDEMHRDLKIVCAKQKITMKDFITETLAERIHAVNKHHDNLMEITGERLENIPVVDADEDDVTQFD